MSEKKGALTRDEKAANLVLNYSMILVAVFEHMFANIASSMSEALVKGSAAMAEAMEEGLGGPPHGKEDRAAAESLSEQAKTRTSAEVKKAFAEMREKARSEIRLDDKSLKKLIRDLAFDKGIEIVERYELGLPKLTERLSDEDFVAYLGLFKNSDPRLVKISEELTEWRKSVPDPREG
ncbi:MAG: hypothetical protein OK438_08460 [Thaumarchaeota archaeon]|nr:hypothetical protein [Nitrososphaerota archaeon]